MADRRLTIEIEGDYVKAYSHDLDSDGNESRDGYGLQGRLRPQVVSGIKQLVDEQLQLACHTHAVGPK